MARIHEARTVHAYALNTPGVLQSANRMMALLTSPYMAYNQVVVLCALVLLI